MIWNNPELLPYLLLAMLPALTFHEWGHAAVANYQGDNTAKVAGRLTLNPLAHLDVFGSIAILLVGFGWAKPVPVNPNNFKNRWSEFWVALAGPGMNIVLATLSFIILASGLLSQTAGMNRHILFSFFFVLLQINLALALFNMIPLGPLDGEKVISKLLPLRYAFAFENWNARYGSQVLMGIILIEMITKVGPFSMLIGYPISQIMQFTSRVAG